MFDQLYLKRYIPKQTAYTWLSSILGVPYSNARIGLLSEMHCQLVICEAKKQLVWHEEHKWVVGANMGLVGKVIKDKVRRLGLSGTPNYHDLFQTGCIGLIKTAITDKGGTFSTYAYRLISISNLR